MRQTAGTPEAHGPARTSRDVIPGVDKPRAAKFARELVEKSLIDLLKRDGVELGNKINPVNSGALGSRIKKHFGDPVRKNFEKIIRVNNLCK